jgi:ribosomal protein S27AE
MRRCAECGYTEPAPQREPRHWHFNEGIDLTPHMQSAAHLVGEQIMADAEENAEVWEAMSHCPQCGSGHFTEYRSDEASRR